MSQNPTMSSCKSRRFVSFLMKRLWRKLIETILLFQLVSFAAVSRDVTQRSPERNISGVRHPERRLGRSLKHNRPVSLFWWRRLLLLLLFLLIIFFIVIISIVINFILLLMFSLKLTEDNGEPSCWLYASWPTVHFLSNFPMDWY